MATDLQRAFDALLAKQASYNQAFNYYDGDQPLMYTAKRLENIFRGLDARFTQNWCAVVIDSVKDRINLNSMRVPDAFRSSWNEMWLESELSLESDECHESALVTGESFVIVDHDGQAYCNDPRLVTVFYDAEFPRVKSFGAKWWVDDGAMLRMTLYYPNHLENYVSEKKAEQVMKFTDFVKMPGNDAEQINPLGTIPVFHFRLSRRAVKSDLKSVIPIQNGINKLLSDMMVAAEFGAFKQRWVISNMEMNGALKNAPSEIWEVPAGDGIGQQTQVGQFDETPLENYLKAIEQSAMSVSSITRTPKHYFFSIGSNLSGESLLAMEAPLAKKAKDRIERFAPVWVDVASLMLHARGFIVSAQDRIQMAAEYDKTDIMQPRTVAEAREINVRAGMPLETVLRDEGKSQDYIDQMLADKQDDAARQETSLATSLLSAQRRFNAGAQ
jgi:hypothetical protein